MAIFLTLTSFALFPSVRANPFFVSCVGGSAILFYAALQRPDVRSELINIGIWLPMSIVIDCLILTFLEVLTPTTIDSALDFGIGRHMMAWGQAHAGCNLFLDAIYKILPIAIAAAIGHSESPRRATIMLVYAGLLALPLYVVFPAKGPAFVSYPDAPRNCMPSLHLTWALLLIYICDKRMRGIFVVFAALTAVATLTTGQHYLLDLIAAVPYALILVWIFGKSANRARSTPPHLTPPAATPYPE